MSRAAEGQGVREPLRQLVDEIRRGLQVLQRVAEGLDLVRDLRERGRGGAQLLRRADRAPEDAGLRSAGHRVLEGRAELPRIGRPAAREDLRLAARLEI